MIKIFWRRQAFSIFIECALNKFASYCNLLRDPFVLARCKLFNFCIHGEDRTRLNHRPRVGE